MLDESGASVVMGSVVSAVSGIVVTLVEGVVLSVTAGAVVAGDANAVKDTKTRRIAAKSAARLRLDAVGMTKDPFAFWFSYENRC